MVRMPIPARQTPFNQPGRLGRQRVELSAERRKAAASRQLSFSRSLPQPAPAQTKVPGADSFILRNAAAPRDGTSQAAGHSASSSVPYHPRP